MKKIRWSTKKNQWNRSRIHIHTLVPESQLQEEAERETARAVRETGICGGAAEAEDSASDQLLKRLYVRRDTRTMEEFAGSESRKGPGYYPVETRENRLRRRRPV